MNNITTYEANIVYQASTSEASYALDQLRSTLDELRGIVEELDQRLTVALGERDDALEEVKGLKYIVEELELEAQIHDSDL